LPTALLLSAFLFLQAPTSDVLGPLNFFIGEWTGTSSGKPGQGTVRRTYELTLNSRVLQVENRVVYLPQEKNKSGETHDDLGLITFDRGRKRFVYRQAHSEGFVNTYVADPVESGAKTVVFTSESIENIPNGWRARETYLITGPDSFVERFELAEPGNDFTPYSEAVLTRVKR
jgi:THAP4-like, heme-binding beta-barrel domain